MKTLSAIILALIMSVAGAWAVEAQTVPIATSSSTGDAPLSVSFTAACPTCVSYVWAFGDNNYGPFPRSLTQQYTFSQPGIYDVVFAGSDLNGDSHIGSAVVTVNSPTNAFDGPAALPHVFITTSMLGTPAGGWNPVVSTGVDLQAALNSATCGDTIQVQAGAVLSGVFTFPAKPCDDNHWIIVRTSASDSVLPREGSRLTPCYAGVSALVGRPDFACATTANVLPKLVASTNNGPIVFASGANHYRLLGLEITRPVGTSVVTALASIAPNGTANNLIFDRVWMHGTPQDETTRGVWLAGGTYVSIIDSFFTDFHCISVTGSCGDSQAIAGGAGNYPGGPYKIVDNFLEASGETILFGGSAATTVPADIQISHNHLFKPLTWLKGQPSFIGGVNGNPFIVKNLFELKSAQRVLFEGNILEDVWGGFSQVGFAILLTPKNAGGSSLCLVCQVTDVTIRYDSISHVGAGLQIANVLSDSGATTLDGQRYSIHDIVIDDIDAVKYGGPGTFAQVSTNVGAPLLQNVAINHVTAFPAHTQLTIGDTVATSGQMKNVLLSNSILSAGVYPVWSTGGGSTNCAYFDQPSTTFASCFSPSAFVNNAVIGSSTSYSWPVGTFLPSSNSAVGFANYNNGNGGDYTLLSTSPYHGMGTDGKDLGADIGAIRSATAGVN